MQSIGLISSSKFQFRAVLKKRPQSIGGAYIFGHFANKGGRRDFSNVNIQTFWWKILRFF